MAGRSSAAEQKGRMASAYTDDDASLMSRVAEARDAEAFAEFLHRHQAAAFNLACYLTRNRDEAEEVLQEAFLRVWRHSGDFNSEGCARNWMLKIVAHETFRVRNRKRSNEEKKVRAQNRGPLQAADAPDQSAERDELLGALRIYLQDLCEEERRAVALYYGAGCTQEEIGKALDCSQNKISYILNQALGKLRTRLTEAGYAAALPLLAQEGLQSAICGGGEAPVGVANAVLRSLKADAAEHSRRAAAAKAGWGTLALALLPVGGVVIWMALGQVSEEKERRTVKEVGAQLKLEASEANLHPSKPATTASAPQPLAEPRTWTFDFSQRQATNFTTLPYSWNRTSDSLDASSAGNWQWVPPGAQPFGYQYVKNAAVLLLPLEELPLGPVEVVATLLIPSNAESHYKVAWIESSEVRPPDGHPQLARSKEAWGQKGRFLGKIQPETALDVRYVFNGQYAIALARNQYISIYRYDRAYPAKRLALLVRGVGVQKIQVSSLTPEQLSEDLRNPEKLLNRLLGSEPKESQ